MVGQWDSMTMRQQDGMKKEMVGQEDNETSISQSLY